jgi:hypothetical protein
MSQEYTHPIGGGFYVRVPGIEYDPKRPVLPIKPNVEGDKQMKKEVFTGLGLVLALTGIGCTYPPRDCDERNVQSPGCTYPPRDCDERNVQSPGCTYKYTQYRGVRE